MELRTPVLAPESGQPPVDVQTFSIQVKHHGFEIFEARRLCETRIGGWSLWTY